SISIIRSQSEVNMKFNKNTKLAGPALGTGLTLLGMLAIVMGISAVHAADSGAKDAKNERVDIIGKKLTQARPDLKVTNVEATEIKGVEKVEIDGRDTIYVIQNGDYFFVGDLYRVEQGGLVNVTEQAKNGQREEL